MPHLRAIVVVLLALTVPPVPGSASDDVSPQAEVLAFFELYAERASTMDWDGLLSLYSDDSRFHWTESGYLAYDGKASVAEHIHTLAPLIDQLEFEILKPRVLVLSTEYSHASLRFRETVTLVSGETIELEGAMTALLVRDDGVWRLLSGHTSISPPPEPAPQEARAGDRTFQKERSRA